MELLDLSTKSILRNSNVELRINEDVFFTDRPLVAIDVETDETPQHNIVGAALYKDRVVYYYTKDHIDQYKKLVDSCRLVGHSIKQDLHWLNIGSLDNVVSDTMLMSYTLNPIKVSHGLKQLSKELLQFVYPSYRDVVGKGRNKKTLDKQDVETVASYCGLDTFATWRLYIHFMGTMTSEQLEYVSFEMQVMKCLYLMECKGITVDVKHLEKLEVEFRLKINSLEAEMTRIIGTEIKYTSPIQVKQMFAKEGLILLDTKRSTLQDYDSFELVQKLLQHREFSKLYSTYIKGLLKLSTLPKVYTTFNQVSTDNKEDDWSGIRTGRLSSSKPNLHSIPTRTDAGKLLREAFIASPEHSLIVADYSQIEYRLLAHFSREPLLVNAYRCGRDVHEETGKMFGVGRDVGKTLNFAAIYGAQCKKISRTAKISIPQAQKLLMLYWVRLPFVKIWMTQLKDQARKNGYIKTIVGRVIPIEGMCSFDKFERYKAERRAVNYTIQGSAADIIKIAMLQLQRKQLLPILQVHDELIFDIPKTQDLEEIKKTIKLVMESAKELIVPIEVDIGIGKTWREAKQ